MIEAHFLSLIIIILKFRFSPHLFSPGAPSRHFLASLWTFFGQACGLVLGFLKTLSIYGRGFDLTPCSTPVLSVFQIWRNSRYHLWAAANLNLVQRPGVLPHHPSETTSKDTQKLAGWSPLQSTSSYSSPSCTPSSKSWFFRFCWHPRRQW